jgi:integrase/recombinase XerD
MDDTIKQFALYLAAEGKKPKTIRTYTDAASWLWRELDVDEWQQVTKAHIRSHVASIIERYSKSYASNQFRALQQFFRFLADEEDITNPMLGMKPPKVPEKLSVRR